MRACVLSGGGSKGAFQVGVLKRWMSEQGMDYDILCGTSVGAINSAIIGMTKKGDPKAAYKVLEDFWVNKLSSDKVYKKWFPFGIVSSLWKTSAYDSSPLFKTISENYDAEAVKQSGRKISVTSVNMQTGECRSVRETEHAFDRWILASSAASVFFSPVMIEGNLWTDGGIKNMTPIGDAIRMGATEIDVVMCTNPESVDSWNPDSKNAIPNQLLRVIELMSEQTLINDLKICSLKNDLTILNDKYKKVKVRIVAPDGVVNDDPFDFDPEHVKRMINYGYQSADRFVTFG